MCLVSHYWTHLCQQSEQGLMWTKGKRPAKDLKLQPLKPLKPLKMIQKMMMMTMVLCQGKKTNVSEQMTVDQEQHLVEFFAVHPLFFDQMLKEFKDHVKKDHPKKDHLLDEKGAELGMTGGCTISSNRTSKNVATL